MMEFVLILKVCGKFKIKDFLENVVFLNFRCVYFVYILSVYFLVNVIMVNILINFKL